VLLTVTGEQPTFVGAKARYVAPAADDLVEAEDRLVAYRVQQLQERAPSVDLAAIRARCS
jgi:hypothetical protein